VFFSLFYVFLHETPLQVMARNMRGLKEKRVYDPFSRNRRPGKLGIYAYSYISSVGRHNFQKRWFRGVVLFMENGIGLLKKNRQDIIGITNVLLTLNEKYGIIEL